MNDILDFFMFVLKCLAVVSIVGSVVGALKARDAYERKFAYNDGIACRHFILCRDISIMCEDYKRSNNPELEKEILSKFDEMLTIDRNNCFEVRCSLYFSQDMYCSAIYSMKETGLARKYEEKYHERSKEESKEKG